MHHQFHVVLDQEDADVALADEVVRTSPNLRAELAEGIADTGYPEEVAEHYLGIRPGVIKAATGLTSRRPESPEVGQTVAMMLRVEASRADDVHAGPLGDLRVQQRISAELDRTRVDERPEAVILELRHAVDRDVHDLRTIPGWDPVELLAREPDDDVLVNQNPAEAGRVDRSCQCHDGAHGVHRCAFDNWLWLDASIISAGGKGWRESAAAFS
jgi:hypothetical protein